MGTGGRRRQVLVAAAGFWLAAILAPPVFAQGGDVVVFAAASLKNALDDVASAWSRETGKRAVASYAASNTLAKQIEQGAPADLFISADLDWMDWAQGKGLIRPETRMPLAANRLVVVAPRDEPVAVEIGPGLDLAAALKGGRLAMANADAVPAGRYGKAALRKLGAWDGVKDRTAQTDTVRAALLLVARGEAPLGIVYRTDAAAEPKVSVVATFPEDSHPPIVYPVALTQTSTNPDAAAFLRYLASAASRPFFDQQGFTFLPKSPSGS